MNWSKVCCIFGVHEWSKWRTVKAAGGNVDPQLHPSLAAWGERRCKRCGKTEEGPAPKKRTRRASNAADTIQRPGNG